MKQITATINFKFYRWLLVVGGFVGLIAAFILTLDKFELLKNPDYNPACNLNPVLSCGSIIGTDQASAFGFPNPLIGIAGFTIIITIGMALFAGAQFKKWFWVGLQLGTIFGLVFIHWLMYQSFYSIGALCIYCIVVWSVTWPIFWYTFLYNIQNKNIVAPKRLQGLALFARKHHIDILVSWYIIVILLILQNFWYYWKTLL